MQMISCYKILECQGTCIKRSTGWITLIFWQSMGVMIAYIRKYDWSINE